MWSLVTKARESLLLHSILIRRLVDASMMSKNDVGRQNKTYGVKFDFKGHFLKGGLVFNLLAFNCSLIAHFLVLFDERTGIITLRI